MAGFAKDVDVEYFFNRVQFRNLLHAFSHDFTITWAADRKSHNSDISIFLLKPENHMAELFGFQREIALFYSKYKNTQARIFPAIEQFCNDSPLKGRIDQTVSLLLSEDPKCVEFTNEYQIENPQSKIFVPMYANSYRTRNESEWSLRNTISEHLFSRNLFDYKLPLTTDMYFYGRDDISARLIDNFRKSENSAIFGLRKTGKTSLLLKFQRMIEASGDGKVLYIDCKRRAIRSQGCDPLIWKMVEFVDSSYQKNFSNKRDNTQADPLEVLDEAVRSIPKSQKICFIFDEIEYISPMSPTDIIWKKDFIDMWQGLWSIQSTNEKVTFVVCGVNSTVVDVSRFKSSLNDSQTVQNPMFSIFRVEYLKGFDLQTLRLMVNVIGSKMGLLFSREAIDYLFNEYGGHPLISRLACAFHQDQLITEKVQRPFSIDVPYLESASYARDRELSSYCEHVISEIREFYPDEYLMLEYLATRNLDDFNELKSDPTLIKHINDYGLIDNINRKSPKFNIGVVQDYIRRMKSKDSEDGFFRDIVPENQRLSWIASRKRTLVSDFETLSDALNEEAGYKLIGSGFGRRIEEFSRLDIVENVEILTHFLVKMNIIFVEPVEAHLKSQGVRFYNDFENKAPDLFLALMRMKLYRHKFCHYELDEKPKARYLQIVRNDFQNVNANLDDQNPFVVQQIILDEFHFGVQSELGRY